MSVLVASSPRLVRALTVAFACAAGGVVAFAQDAETRVEDGAQAEDEAHVDLTELSLEDLMGIEVETVHGASRRAQSSLEAPSSVSVVGADEIALFDRRTLAEILRAVGSFDVTDDRNYEHLGVRGFNPLGDYNSRVLLSLEGHRLNNGVYDTAPIGRDAPIDVALLERVEVVRGPGSALYGSNAFFGVVDMQPKSGADIDGVEVSVGAESYDGWDGRVTWGRELDDGGDWLVSATAYTSDGAAHFYDEFANSPTGGTTIGRDYEDGYSLYTRWSRGDWTISGVWGSREKGIPTASFDTVLDAANRTTDAQGYVDVAWRPELSEHTSLELRAAYDRYEYDGFYVYDNSGSGGTPEDPYFDDALGEALSASALVTTSAWTDHTLSFGAEARRDLALDQHAFDAYGTYTDDEQDRSSLGTFANDEWRVAEHWRLHAGLRYDDATQIDGQWSPRAGLVWLPDEESAVKLLYGRAFRAPNAYEKFYGDGSGFKPNPALQPESIETFELVWERIVAGRWRASASLYHYEIDDLIVQVFDPLDGSQVFRNQSEVRANGLELECERTFDSSVRVRASFGVQTAEDTSDGDELTNSPRQLGKLQCEIPIWNDAARFALEAQTTSSRLTNLGDRTSGFLLVNAALYTAQLADGVSLSLGVHNVFDGDVYDPVGPELVHDALLQDGRSLRLRLTISR